MWLIAEVMEESGGHVDIDDKAHYVVGYLDKGASGKSRVDMQLLQSQGHNSA